MGHVINHPTATPADTSLPLQGTVLLEERNVYGNLQLYPANNLARFITDLTGAKTFTPRHVATCKAMGLRLIVAGASPREL